jgi:anti-anti-sigma factor
MFSADMVKDSAGSVSRIILAGQIDGPASSELDQTLAAATRGESGRLLLDLTQVSFVTSAGLRVFLSFAKKMKKAERKMVLYGAPAGVLSSFEMAGFTRIMTFRNSLEEALAALEADV